MSKKIPTLELARKLKRITTSDTSKDGRLIHITLTTCLAVIGSDDHAEFNDLLIKFNEQKLKEYAEIFNKQSDE